MGLKYPAHRTLILKTLAELGDPEIQQRQWLDPQGRCFNLRDADSFLAHIFYEGVEGQTPIGEFLRSQVEYEAALRLKRIYYQVLNKHESLWDMPAILTDPDWPEVVRLAGEALAVFCPNGMADEMRTLESLTDENGKPIRKLLKGIASGQADSQSEEEKRWAALKKRLYYHKWGIINANVHLVLLYAAIFLLMMYVIEFGRATAETQRQLNILQSTLDKQAKEKEAGK